jgi:amino acid adenylation domain-containing protein
MDDLTTRLSRLTPRQRALLDRRLATRVAGTGRIPRLGAVRAPLTVDQERIWLLNRLDPADPAYNVFFGSRLRGALDTRALERAVNAVVARHEALRTTFEPDGLRPVMVVHPSMPIALSHVDLSGLPADERPRRADEETDAAIRSPFDLERGPLLRITLLRLAPDEHLVIGTVHHLVWDRGSSGIFAAELAEHYTADVLGERPRPPDLPIQYADYARWQAGWIEREVKPRHLPYWRERLAGAALVLDLPTDRPRPPVRSFRGARHRFRIDEDLTEAVRAHARREGVTVNVVLLAAWKLLLAKMTGQPDVVVGTTSSTRGRPEAAPLIGYFVTVLPLRTTVRPAMTVRQLTHAVRDTVTGALDHHDTPFGVLLDELDVPRDPSRNPLYQTSFIYVDFHYEKPADMPGLDHETVPLDNRTVKDELTFGVFDDLASGGTFLGMLEYSTDLFTEETVDRIAGRLTVLLRAMVTAPGEQVGNLSPLTGAERATTVSRWNDTARPVAARRVDELVRAQARATPGAVAVRGADGSLTYRDLVARAERLAGYLRGCGVRDGDIVGVCLPRAPGTVVALLGVLMAGAAYQPLDPGYPPARLALMTSDAGPVVVLAEESTAGRLSGCAARIVLVDRCAAGIAAAPPPAAVTPEAGCPAYVIYTSGSTGRPKGVVVTHGNFVNLLESMRDELGLTAADRWAAVTPTSFDMSAPEIFAPLVTGGTVVVLSRADAADGQRLAAALAEHDVTVMQGTPATWQLLLEAGWRDGGRLRAVCGGEAMPPALRTALLRGPRRVWNAYGPTETTVWSTIDEVTGGDGVTIGRPLANTRVYVLDERLHPVPVGVSGELYIAGDGVALGYRGRFAETAARFVADPFGPVPGGRLYRTGDVVHWRPDGRLVYERRNDSQVKLRGHRIELGEVEARIAAQPEVRRAVAVVREDRPGDRRLVAYVQQHADTPLSLSRLRDRLRAALPEYLTPNVFVPVDSFPLNPSGKVDRAALPAPADVAVPDGLVAPRDEVELAVARIWARVLGVPEVGVTSNFFDLGGHSLLVLGLMAEIEREFGVALPMAAIFQGATVERFARLLRDRPETDREARVVPLRAGTGTPVFFAHLAGNDLMPYLALVARLRPADRPVYGLSSPVAVDGVLPYATVADRAIAYADAVRSVQPAGPYTLVGWSYGGVSAHAVAHRLEAGGADVRVIMVDSFPPQRLITEEAASRVQVVAAVAQQLYGGPLTELTTVAELAALSDDEQLTYLLRLAEAGGHLPVGSGRNHIAALLTQWTADFGLLTGYRPPPVAGQVVLVRAAEEDPDPMAAWNEAATAGVRVEVVPGDHMTVMREPHVTALADIVNQVLAGG